MRLNGPIILRFLGLLLMLNGTFMAASAIASAIFQDGSGPALLVSGALTLIVGLAGYIFGSTRDKNISKRDGYLIVSLGWVVMALSGCLPFIISGEIPSFVDALFETMSGYTTTGATILEDIEVVAPGLLLWRSITHWIGGMGIIVLTIAILPLLGIGGMQLFSAEAPGPSADKLHPRITETAKRLWAIYVMMTMAEIVLLKLGGLTWFDSITHSFATVSTGGFSTKNASIGHFDSAYVQYVITAFMFMSGVNFSLTYFALKGRISKLYKNEEFLAFTSVILGLTLLTAVILWLVDHGGVEHSFRDALFQVTAMVTTTGFVTTDLTKIPGAPMLTVLLFLLLFSGGSAGSTAGGVKIVRHMIIAKNGIMELKRLLHPNAVIPVRFDGRPVRGRITFNIMAFFLIYLSIFVVSSMTIGLTGLGFETSIGAVASCLGNVGPAIGDVCPSCNYAGIGGFGKLFLAILMLIGRLEIFTILILFTPYFWRRY